LLQILAITNYEEYFVAVHTYDYLTERIE
jgi:hypothetical protein